MAIIAESVILRMGMDADTDGGAAGADSTLAESSLGPLTQDRSAPQSWLMESTNARARSNTRVRWAKSEITNRRVGTPAATPTVTAS